MKKHMRWICMILILVSILPTASAADVSRQGSEPVSYRFVNLTGQSVDLYRNESAVFFGNRVGVVSAERVIEMGRHNFVIYAENVLPGAGAPLVELGIDLIAGSNFLLIASEDENGQVIASTHNFDTNPLPANRARLELVNQTTTALSIVGQNQDTLVENGAAGESFRADVPGGLYQISVQDAASGAQIAARTINATPGNLVTLIAYGEDNIRLASVENILEQTAFFRLFHAARTSPAVDVYVSGTPIFSALEYKSGTAYTMLDPGSHLVEVYETGSLPESTEPLWSGTVQLPTNAPITAVFLGETSVRLVVNQDDHLMIPENRARVRFINAALNLLQLTVRDDGSEPLVGGLDYVLGSRNQNIEPGTRTLVFRETDGADYVTLRNFNFEANHFYTFVVVGNALIDGNVEVVLMNWDWHTGPVE